MSINSGKRLLIAFILNISWGLNVAQAMTELEYECLARRIVYLSTTPLAKLVMGLSVILLGFNIAFGGEASTGSQRAFQLVFGLSISLTALFLLSMLFGIHFWR